MRAGRVFRKLLVCIGLPALVWACSYAIDEADLRRRVDSSQPSWESYQEDVKGQVGATPVAQWEGALEEVRATTGTVTVVFRMSGPWRGVPIAMPILLREPFLNVHEPDETRFDGDRVTYVFTIEEAERPDSMAWIELRYPRASRRVTLSKEGIWRAPAP